VLKEKNNLEKNYKILKKKRCRKKEREEKEKRKILC